MKSPLYSGNLRWRLTFWYGTVFTLLLLLHIGVAVVVHYRQLLNQTFHDEIEDLKNAEGLIYQTPSGGIDVREDYFNHPQARLSMNRLLQVMEPNGTILYRNNRLNGQQLDGPPVSNEGVSNYHPRIRKLKDGRAVLVISHTHRIDGRLVLLRFAYEAAPLYSNVVKFLMILLLLAPISVLLAGVVIYRVTSNALSPLSLMVKRAQQINAEHLKERLPVLDPEDDLGQATIEFNALLQRLDDSFSQLKRFTSDASHELRTPLASMRSMGEVCLRSPKSVPEYCDVISNMLEEVARLTNLVESLLVIARNDDGQTIVAAEEVNCQQIIQQIVDLVEILADEKQQKLLVDCAGDLDLHADRGMVRQAILNVLDNAIKYSPPDSTIRIAAKNFSARTIEITVSDQGPGIPEAERLRIFDRFRRIDDGRSRARGGAGLGLSIARWAVEANGGTIGVCAQNTPGSCFYLRFPTQPKIAQ